MRFSTLVATLFTLSSLSPVLAAANPDLHPTSSAPHVNKFSKRTLLCTLLPILCNFQTDPLNCGVVNNVCPTSWGLGALLGEAVCVNGVCGAQCNPLWVFNWLTSACQSVGTDVNNCGSIGNVCTTSLVGSSVATCTAGTCIATTCMAGYTLTSGACVKIINLLTDVNNCGTKGHVCQASWTYGVGSTCLSGVCEPLSCNTGFAFSTASNTCIPVLTDTKNCGAVGNVCSFPHGAGGCTAGVCTVTSCTSGYYNVANICTSLNLQTDANNCGAVGNVCLFPNGIGSCTLSTCTYSSCNTGYTLGSNVCTAISTVANVNNCGAIGHICPVPLNSASAFCANSVCGANCNSGYGYSSIGACISIASDPNNCGAVGNVCSFPGATALCSAGLCHIGTCLTGYYSVGGACVTLNLQTDVNNCGTQSHVCPTSYANGLGATTCVAGICTSACIALYAWNGATCQTVGTDINNCGAIGHVCSVPNGIAKCTAGVCAVSSCGTNYINVNGVCTYYNLQSDVNNCGSIGHVCSFANGAGSCSAGVCTYSSCVSPYVISANVCNYVNLLSDVNNCGTVGHVCPSYLNGGASICLNSVCQTTCNTGYAFDFTYNFCRGILTDMQNCGAVGAICSPYAAVSAQCAGGLCTALSCFPGFKLVSGVCTLINVLTDPNNCGFLGNVCSFPSPTVGICSVGVCTVVSCGGAGYTLVNNVCVKTTASARARLVKKEVDPVKRSLCPSDEEACPIIGSNSYDLAVSQHFTSGMTDFTADMGSGVGYECLDTSQSLESCGGCASTGAGQDCSKIRGAVGVGCDSGACVVFSCLAGWRPNMAGTRCVRAKTDPAHALNSTRTSAPRRHLHARQGSHNL